MFSKRHRGRSFGSVLLGLCVSLFCYFGYHTINGDHGIEARGVLKTKISRLSLDLSHLTRRRQLLDRDVALMQPDQIDPDILDEQARRVLNFARPDEIIVLRLDEN